MHLLSATSGLFVDTSIYFSSLLHVGEGAEDSLYWVTYAVQPSRMIPRAPQSAGAWAQEEVVKPIVPSASQKAAEMILGEVCVCV